MAILACTGKPTFDYTGVQSWPIFGSEIQFATHDFANELLLVQAIDGSYVIVRNVQSFNAAQATQDYCFYLISTNPTTC
jgi:hypothetical protein